MLESSVKTLSLYGATTAATLACLTVKLLTRVSAKAALYKVSGYHTEAATYFEKEYLKTVKVLRDAAFNPGDTDDVGTRLRHGRRSADTEEKQKTRGAAAQAVVAAEEKRFKAAGPVKNLARKI